MEFYENCKDCSPSPSEDVVKEFFILAPTPLIWQGVVQVGQKLIFLALSFRNVLEI